MLGHGKKEEQYGPIHAPPPHPHPPVPFVRILPFHDGLPCFLFPGVVGREGGGGGAVVCFYSFLIRLYLQLGTLLRKTTTNIRIQNNVSSM